MLQRVAQAAEALEGFITVTRFLDEAQRGRVEEIIHACVREANQKVDEELFGKNRSLPDSECGKEPPVGVDRQ